MRRRGIFPLRTPGVVFFPIRAPAKFPSSIDITSHHIASRHLQLTARGVQYSRSWLSRPPFFAGSLQLGPRFPELTVPCVNHCREAWGDSSYPSCDHARRALPEWGYIPWHSSRHTFRGLDSGSYVIQKGCSARTAWKHSINRPGICSKPFMAAA